MFPLFNFHSFHVWLIYDAEKVDFELSSQVPSWSLEAPGRSQEGAIKVGFFLKCRVGEVCAVIGPKHVWDIE